MLEVEVLDDPVAAAIAIEPARARLLAALTEPASAAALAERLRLPRQQVNYHLRVLEQHGLVREAETRSWGGITERRMIATANSYVVSPGALGPAGADPRRTADRLSASYLLALAGRALREVGELVRKAVRSGQRLATLSLDTEIRFRNGDERAAFSRELTAAVANLAARYHDPRAAGGRWHRLVVVAHPIAGGAESPVPTTPTEP